MVCLGWKWVFTKLAKGPSVKDISFEGKGILGRFSRLSMGNRKEGRGVKKHGTWSDIYYRSSQSPKLFGRD